MVYQHPMFTHRICCCDATVASQVMATIAPLFAAGAAISNWAIGAYINFSIFNTIFLCIELAACVLVFIAVCKTKPGLMLPIIVLQILNTIGIVAFIGWFLIVYVGYLSLWTIMFSMAIYVCALLLSIFVAHCHVCCYKLLLFTRSAHNHCCAPGHYNA